MSEHQKPSPAGQGGNYLAYRIGGDIGGHWFQQLHDDFTNTGHFIWLPTIDRLMFAGFHQQANELKTITEEIVKTGITC